jgi:hypothetical protein
VAIRRFDMPDGLSPMRLDRDAAPWAPIAGSPTPVNLLVDLRLRPGGDSQRVGRRTPGVYCNASPGCRSVWYRPRHEP